MTIAFPRALGPRRASCDGQSGLSPARQPSTRPPYEPSPAHHCPARASSPPVDAPPRPGRWRPSHASRSRPTRTRCPRRRRPPPTTSPRRPRTRPPSPARTTGCTSAPVPRSSCSAGTSTARASASARAGTPVSARSSRSPSSRARGSPSAARRPCVLAFPSLGHLACGAALLCVRSLTSLLGLASVHQTAVFALPPFPFEAPAQLLSLPSAPSLSAHPTTPSFLLAHLSIFALGSDQPAIELEPWTDKGVWATCWSWDGRFVCGVGKDGSVGVWDPRSGTAVVGVRTLVSLLLLLLLVYPHEPLMLSYSLWRRSDHAENRPHPQPPQARDVRRPRRQLPRHRLLQGALLLPDRLRCESRLTSDLRRHRQSRERVVLVIDPLSPAAPLATSVLDYETAPLLPLVDQDRSLVFLSGKGDSILKYAEFTKGAFAWSAVGLGAPVESLALAPWTRLDVVGKGEIDRLLVLSKQGDIVPVPVVVPQRFYIDFNEATNPPVRSFGAWPSISPLPTEDPRLIPPEPRDVGQTMDSRPRPGWTEQTRSPGSSAVTQHAGKPARRRRPRLPRNLQHRRRPRPRSPLLLRPRPHLRRPRPLPPLLPPPPSLPPSSSRVWPSRRPSRRPPLPLPRHPTQCRLGRKTPPLPLPRRRPLQPTPPRPPPPPSRSPARRPRRRRSRRPPCRAGRETSSAAARP